MSARLFPRFQILGVIGVLLALALGPLPLGSAPVVEERIKAEVIPAKVEARGEAKALVRIPSFGRYSIRAKSGQGVQLQLVDRMTGPKAPEGQPGERDGRLDLFLDVGEYRLLTRGHDKATGQAELSVQPFRERNDPAPQLVEYKLVSDTLADLEQRSYWLQITARRWVYLEATGRSLRELGLWRDGSWLVETRVQTESLEPSPGQPLTSIRLAAELEPGLYRLTAYGGPPQPWSVKPSGQTGAAEPQPFYLRWEIPRLAAEGRTRYHMNPFGLDRWLVPASANYLRLELPESRPAELMVADYDEANPLPPTLAQENQPAADQAEETGEEGESEEDTEAEGEEATGEEENAEATEGEDGATEEEGEDTTTTETPPPPLAQGVVARIEKDSRRPVAELQVEKRPQGWRLVTLRAAAGQPFVLQHFTYEEFYRFEGNGKYWISTLHAGHPEDSVDATALLVRYPHQGEAPKKPLAAQVFKIGAESSWSRRVNLTGPLSLFFRVEQAGRYRVDISGVEARHILEPFHLSPPKDYQPPGWRRGGSVWDLNPGYYVLEVKADNPGVAQLGLSQVAKTKGATTTAPESPPLQASARFSTIELLADSSYGLFLNRQPEVKAGIVVRPLPLDLSAPLPLSLEPGKTVEVPFKVSENGSLQALDESGVALELAVDGAPWATQPKVTPGVHRVVIRHSGQQVALAALGFLPQRLAADVPLPPLPAKALAELPRFLEVSEAQPQFFDLGKESSRTFALRIDQPGFYRLESTGLLATQGILRNRLQPRIATAESGGSGRNFLIDQYLGSGDYQATVTTRGRSAGHLGLRLSRGELVFGGSLTEEIPARAELRSAQGLAYDIEIQRAGEYRLRTLGLRKGFRYRLEDADAWPQEALGIPSDLQRRFAVGRYRLLILPEAVGSRRVSLLEPIPLPLERQGHGPHELALNTRVEYLWLEPDKGAERLPDRWDFVLPAAVETRIQLDGDLSGRLLRLDGEKAEVGSLAPRRGWNGRLAEGRYRIELVASRVNNRLPYALEVRPQALVPGTSQHIEAPAKITVAVGAPRLVDAKGAGEGHGGSRGLVELTSLGTADVRARLLDADGRLIAASDDRQGDWNFHLAQLLAPGDYSLVVDPVGTRSAKTLVRLEARPGVKSTAQDLPFTHSLSLGREVRILPLPLPSSGELLVVGAESKESLGLALEVERNGDWYPLAGDTGLRPRLALALPVAGQVRLRLWSLDRRGYPAEVAVAVAGQATTEEALSRGLELSPIPGLGVAVTHVRLSAPGSFRLAPEGIRVARAAGQPLMSYPGHLTATAGTDLWLMAEAPAAGARLKMERITLNDAPLQLEIAPERPAVMDLESPGLVLVRAKAALGQPLVAGLADQGVAAQTLAGTEALTLRLTKGRTAVRVWPGEGQTTDVQVRRLAYPRPQAQGLGFGMLDGDLLAGEVKALSLPPGAKRLRIAATPGVAAALISGDSVSSLHGGGAEALSESFDTAANLLYLLPGTAEAPRFSLELLPLTEVQQLTPEHGFEAILPSSGTQRLQVAAGTGTLEIRGAAQESRFLSAEGAISTGNRIQLKGGGGILWVPHAPGLLSVQWQKEAVGGSPTQAVAIPSRNKLQGSAQGLVLEPKEGMLLRVTTEVGAELGVRLPGGERHWLQPAGGVVNLYLPAGRAELNLRALAGGQLSGYLELAALPLIDIGEGLGSEVLLPPGGGRAFRFRLSQSSPLGVGVRAIPDRASCELLDIKGATLGTGVVQRHELAAGDYVLLVSAPAEGGPLRIRPALVGLQQPGSGPPEEVIRTYLELAKQGEGGR